jgi:hypothetical protein
MCRCATSADGRSTMAETRSITGVDVTVANFAELPDDCYLPPKGERKQLGE